MGQKLDRVPDRSRRRLGALFQSKAVGIILANIDGTITEANEAFLNLVGYTLGDLPLRWGEMTPAKWRASDEAKIRELLKTGFGAPWEKEYITRDGVCVPVLVGAALLPGPGGECVAFVQDLSVVKEAEAAIQRDRETARKEAEEQILAYQSQLQELTLRSVLGEERERRRIATGLHDDLGQNLATARMLLDGLTDSSPRGETNRRVEAIRSLIDQAIRTTRSLTFELSSPILYELGLEPALRALAGQVTGASGIPFSFDSDGEPRPLAIEAKVILFRVVRELAHNVVKHAGARAARIAVAAVGDEVHLRIEDDGVGIDGSDGRDAVWTEGFGLASVRGELKSIGGRLEIEAEAGKGTRVLVVAPLDGHGET